ncbi:MAG TPA: hypothetical protein DDW52_06650 [Planctomycetaceae bacterium]|nr:hypothetical protein [Planctomycetaceae bacterium]
MMKESPPPNVVQLLSDLYPSGQDARSFVLNIGGRADLMVFEGASSPMWHGILRELRRSITYEQLVDRLKEEEPDLPWEHYDQVILSQRYSEELYVLRGDLWRGDTQVELESCLTNHSQLLPVSYLEGGVAASRSVAKVSVPGFECGSGFLIDGNLLVTSNHVLPDKRNARQARAIFGYESRPDGSISEGVSFELDPNSTFLTVKENKQDWTVTSVKGNPCEQWGTLSLTSELAKSGARVAVIQHPGGLPKCIALANGRVVYADSTDVQYLCETSGGSSGAPVLNDRWEVVGIHRDGGFQIQTLAKSRRRYFRNAGVAIGVVRQRLIDEGLMS